MTAAHVIGNSADFLDPFFLFSRRQPAARRAARPSDPGGIVPRFRPNPSPSHDLDQLYSLYVVGDQMLPDFKPGRLLIVDRSLVPAPGNFVIAKSEEVTLFRRLVHVGGQDFIQPLNPAYPTRPLNPDFRIIGVVIGHLLEEVAQ